MEKNMGTLDKLIRLMIAVIIGILYVTKIISGTTGIILIVLATVFTLTSMINFCPLYKILGINSSSKRK